LIRGSYNGERDRLEESLYHETSDPCEWASCLSVGFVTSRSYYPVAYYVRDRKFFFEGRVRRFPRISCSERLTVRQVFALLVPEPTKTIPHYKYSIQNNYANIPVPVRRFVVVQHEEKFCFTLPIRTYSGRGTTKPGVRAEDHAIAYTWGSQAWLHPNETGIVKAPFGIVTPPNIPPLHKASRIDFGTYYPVQYNVKACDLGYVAKDQLPTLIGYWRSREETTEELADAKLASGTSGSSVWVDSKGEHDEGREDDNDEEYEDHYDDEQE
jgi:hypothetical protein